MRIVMVVLVMLVGCGDDATEAPDADMPDECTLATYPGTDPVTMQPFCATGGDMPPPPTAIGEWRLSLSAECYPTELLVCIQEGRIRIAESPACGMAESGIMAMPGGASLLLGAVDVPMCDGTQLRLCGIELVLGPSSEGDARFMSTCDACTTVGVDMEVERVDAEVDCFGWPE